MVHGVRFREGKAQWYRNRYIGTDTVNKALGRPKIGGKRRGVFDVVNTNAIGHGGRYFALIEGGPFPIEFDGNLKSIRQGLFDSDLSLPYSAHPHLDPATGKLHAICYDTRQVHYIVVDAGCNVERVVTLTSITDVPMIHNCAITSTGVLIFDLPVTLSPKAFLEGRSFPFRWNPKRAARVGFLRFDGEEKDVRWFSVDPCYVFHSCNSFDVPGGGAVVDVVVFETMFAHDTGGRDSNAISFERWTLDPSSGRVQRLVRNQELQEFPRFDERMTGKPYRYGFTDGFSPTSTTRRPTRATLSFLTRTISRATPRRSFTCRYAYRPVSTETGFPTCPNDTRRGPLPAFGAILYHYAAPRKKLSIRRLGKC
jgi:carotenoid cleavage dioxygenase-like enzyme